MKYSVYVLFSRTFDQIYIGYSTNVPGRLLSHNQFAKKGWTIRFRPWILIHTEDFKTKREAMIRERQLKSAQGRAWIRNTLLNSTVH